MKKQKIIIGIVIVALLIAIGMSLKDSSSNGGKQEVSMDDPTTIVLDFYEPWLSAAQSTTTDPYKLDLAKNPILSDELSKKIIKAGKNAKNEIDPVLCQTETPTKISVRTIFESEEEVQLLVLPRDEGLTSQSIITLTALNDGWYINDITCSLGEFAPDREFTFEKEGFFLKDSVPAPLNSKNWHIIFEENGELGHFAPLFFNTESMCSDGGKNQTTCDPSQFSETTKVFVKGSMTEAGVEVKQLEFVKE